MLGRGLKSAAVIRGVLNNGVPGHAVGLIEGARLFSKCQPPSGHRLIPAWLEHQWDCLKINDSSPCNQHQHSWGAACCLSVHPADTTLMGQKCPQPSYARGFDSWCFPSQVTLGASFHLPVPVVPCLPSWDDNAAT